jgi:hypothetical protein
MIPTTIKPEVRIGSLLVFVGLLGFVWKSTLPVMHGNP